MGRIILRLERRNLVGPPASRTSLAIQMVLDGVTPKSSSSCRQRKHRTPTGCDAGEKEKRAKIADIASAFDSLLATLRQKAPAAKIIITAIFPRNETSSAPGSLTVQTKPTCQASPRNEDFLSQHHRNLANSEGGLLDGIRSTSCTCSVRLSSGRRAAAVVAELLGQPLKPITPATPGDPSALVRDSF